MSNPAPQRRPVRPPSPAAPRAKPAARPAYPVAQAFAPPPGPPGPLARLRSAVSLWVYRTLWTMVILLLSTVVFIAGMEVGYWRANRRWQELAGAPVPPPSAPSPGHL